MIVKIGDLFESKCTTIVNTVNCVGVMGKGIALEFKKRYPDMFMDYVHKCNDEKVKPGSPYIYQNEDGTSILNFPTKDHWRSPSRLSYIIDGLDWVVENYEKYDIKSIAFPPLGCGNGGLSWNVVGPIMYQKLSKLHIPVEIYAPFGTNPKDISLDFFSSKVDTNDVVGKSNSKINPKWYLILEVIRELNERKYTLKVGRTIYQKICYVLTRNGVDTGFTFSQANYGPFSSQVKDSITVLANANLIIEKQLGRMISINVAEDVKICKDDFTQEEWDAVHKTVDLFGRVKSTDQAEMVATILFSYDQLKKEDPNISDKDIFDYVVEWKPHWKEQKEFEMCDAIQNMAMLSLINITCSQMLMNTAEVF